VWGSRTQTIPCILWGGATFLMLAWHGNIGLTPFWLISMVWSTLAIKAYNRRFAGRTRDT
jgi:hypothetical protein